MNKIKLGLFCLYCSLLGCQSAQDPAPTPEQHTTTTPQKQVDTWMGKWNGPEGTYIELATKDHQTYQIAIADLDGPKKYEGTADDKGTAINFVRNNITETIKEGNGKDTGMKWLDEKTTCIYIKAGEGFCRE
ncbi:MAG: hypothetical protein JNM36_04840 [Chitinophagales bacterium]|jgi:hypothetical protein|nr:hypothetical protein [Chitinophagales bacterium]